MEEPLERGPRAGQALARREVLHHLVPLLRHPREQEGPKRRGRDDVPLLRGPLVPARRPDEAVVRQESAPLEVDTRHPDSPIDPEGELVGRRVRWVRHRPGPGPVAVVRPLADDAPDHGPSAGAGTRRLIVVSSRVHCEMPTCGAVLNTSACAASHAGKLSNAPSMSPCSFAACTTRIHTVIAISTITIDALASVRVGERARGCPSSG